MLAENPTQNPTQRQRKIRRSRLPQGIKKNRKTESKQLACPELSRFCPREQRNVQTNSGQRGTRTHDPLGVNEVL